MFQWYGHFMIVGHLLDIVHILPLLIVKNGKLGVILVH